MKKIRTYPSGLRLIVEKNRRKNVVFSVHVKVGSANEKPSEYGLAHFVEHLLFKSSEKRNTTQIASDNDYLATLINASTSYTSTKYYINALNENLDKSLEIFSDMMLNHLWLKEEVDVERQVVLEEMKVGKDNSSLELSLLTSESFFHKTKFNHGVIGESEIIKNCSIDKIKKFYNQYYTPNNIIISVAGGIGFGKIKRLVKKYFSQWLQGENVPKRSFDYNGDNPVKSKYVTSEKESDLVKVEIDIKCPDRNSVQFYNYAFLSILLSNGLSSVLYANLIEKKGLAYSISTNINTFLSCGIFSFLFRTSNKNVKSILKEIKNIMNDISQNGFSDFDFEKTKNNYKRAILSASASNKQLAFSNIGILIMNFKQKSKKELLAILNKITKQDIQNAVNQLLNEEHFVVGAIGKNIKKSDLKAFK